MPQIPDPAELAGAKVSAVLKRKLARNLKDFQALKERETRALKELRTGLSSKLRILAALDLGANRAASRISPSWRTIWN